ncbi:MAG: phosphoribosyltransferase [Acidobacteria bacterium]|nr:MAG: phosphoribosyltransferase [Acidobacteriota bacterium]
MFRDRQDAGQQLARRLARFAQGPEGVVFAIPRGGVIVAGEVAKVLGWPLDVVILRKLGVPGHEELAFGAIAAAGSPVLDSEIMQKLGLSDAAVQRVIEMARAEVKRREQLYRQGRPARDIAGKPVIVVDDGIATGADMRAAIRVLRPRNPRQLVIAVPVAPPDACDAARFAADDMVCLSAPYDYYAVGQVYQDFRQITDEAVVQALAEADAAYAQNAARARAVTIRTGGVDLEGTLGLPAGARGLVLFAHGSGSSRHSPRNRRVAERLHGAGLGTLLFDLLSPEEEVLDHATAGFRFDIPLLAGRLRHATRWAAQQAELEQLDFGYFGASTGAAAALMAAAGEPRVTTIVSRGGRPDLAGPALGSVRAATLFIVGGRDTEGIALNQDALARCAAPVKKLVIVPSASHLFEESGALDEVARLAATWFTDHLSSHLRAA